MARITDMNMTSIKKDIESLVSRGGAEYSVDASEILAAFVARVDRDGERI